MSATPTPTNQMKIETFQTARRQYKIREYDVAGNAVFYAEYRPINKKTGQAWQASRSLGGNINVRSNHNTGVVVIFLSPVYPQNWDENGKFNSVRVYFNSKAAAFAAVKADADKQKETFLTLFPV
jgi:hypothetical protein